MLGEVDDKTYVSGHCFLYIQPRQTRGDYAPHFLGGLGLTVVTPCLPEFTGGLVHSATAGPSKVMSAMPNYMVLVALP